MLAKSTEPKTSPMLSFNDQGGHNRRRPIALVVTCAALTIALIGCSAGPPEPKKLAEAIDIKIATGDRGKEPSPAVIAAVEKIGVSEGALKAGLKKMADDKDYAAKVIASAVSPEPKKMAEAMTVKIAAGDRGKEPSPEAIASVEKIGVSEGSLKAGLKKMDDDKDYAAKVVASAEAPTPEKMAEAILAATATGGLNKYKGAEPSPEAIAAVEKVGVYGASFKAGLLKGEADKEYAQKTITMLTPPEPKKMAEAVLAAAATGGLKEKEPSPEAIAAAEKTGVARLSFKAGLVKMEVDKTYAKEVTSGTIGATMGEMLKAMR